MSLKDKIKDRYDNLFKDDFQKRLKFLRFKRTINTRRGPILISAGVLLLVLVILLFTVGLRSCSKYAERAEESRQESIAQSESESIRAQEEAASIAARESMEESQRAQEEEQKRIADEIIASYKNLGVVDVGEGAYLNVREQASPTAHIIGKMYNYSACDVISDDGSGWAMIDSGGFEGYVSTSFLLTGDEAESLARDNVKDRAIVLTDELNIRSEASKESDVVATALEGERYEVLDIEGDWVKIPSGYLFKDYVEIRPCLNEARKLDMKSMVVNMYDDLGISNTTNYLNIREEPSEDGKIIGKLTSRAACDIVEKLDGWYKIKSGPVRGYVKAEYITTGEEAKELAMQEAQLMAIVTTDVLNVRTEPSEDSSVWTQVSNAERYHVVSQLDGWVEIELEDDLTAFASSQYLDVRYALNEAIKFSPLEEAAANSSRIRNSLVNYALQFVGNPYVWGGTSLTNGCDCSGFTMQIMKEYGVSLPHYSGSQAQMGTKVTSDSMRPGDLIFYANSSGTINHVAIYIGNGQIVHAASRRSGIKISSWNYRTPKAIRNVLGD
jgi:cell wall-associated NlpC family hydrolase/SH3-like domain-containing protein